MAVSKLKVAEVRKSGVETLASGVTYQKSGNICNVVFEGYKSSTTGIVNVGTLPEGYRPSITAQGCLHQNGTNMVAAWCLNTGLLQLRSNSTTQNIAGTLTFITA